MSPARRRDQGTVFSSEHGRMCPHCSLPTKRCQCRKNPRGSAAPAGDGIVRVARESKGRGGKVVSLIKGLALPPDELKELAGELKRRCGTGGAVKDGVIEIQGEHRDTLVEELERRGHKVKKAGG